MLDVCESCCDVCVRASSCSVHGRTCSALIALRSTVTWPSTRLTDVTSSPILPGNSAHLTLLSRRRQITDPSETDTLTNTHTQVMITFSQSINQSNGSLSQLEGVGLATRWSRVRFPAAAATTGKGHRLRAGTRPRYFIKTPRPTQPPTLRSPENQYWPKCADVM